jgi:hypothetical protein
MVERGILHIEDDRLCAKGTYRVIGLQRHDNDHILFFPDLHLINAFKPRFGNVHPVFCHFCSHRILLDKVSRSSIIPQMQGDLPQAIPVLERALEFARAHQEWGNGAYALWLFGEVAAHRAPPEGEEAEAHYRQALALAEELGMRLLQAHCQLGLGTLYTT